MARGNTGTGDLLPIRSMPVADQQAHLRFTVSGDDGGLPLFTVEDTQTRRLHQATLRPSLEDPDPLRHLIVRPVGRCMSEIDLSAPIVTCLYCASDSCEDAIIARGLRAGLDRGDEACERAASMLRLLAPAEDRVDIHPWGEVLFGPDGSVAALEMLLRPFQVIAVEHVTFPRPFFVMSLNDLSSESATCPGCHRERCRSRRAAASVHLTSEPVFDALALAAERDLVPDPATPLVRYTFRSVLGRTIVLELALDNADDSWTLSLVDPGGHRVELAADRVRELCGHCRRACAHQALLRELALAA